jgi:3-oxoacyl-[acyl-carrier-protein] synthase III
MPPSTFLSSISHRLGEPVELSELTQVGISEDTIANLRVRGFERFLRQTENPVDVWSACATAAINEAGIKPDDIDLVLIAASSHLLQTGLHALQLTGVGRSKVLGISLQDCCAGIVAVSIAAELALRENNSRHILAIVPWVSPDAARVEQNRDIVFSDGTIAFVVSNKKGDFEIVASEYSTDPKLAALERDPSRKPGYLLAGLDNIQSTAERTLQKSGIHASSLRAVFCTNGNSVFQDAIGMATSTRELVYKDTFSRFGHVLACDELLGLKTYTEEIPTRDGDLFLLISWAPYGSAACVLKQCFHD